MLEQLISFETAKLAKEKGFDEIVFCYFSDGILNDDETFLNKTSSTNYNSKYWDKIDEDDEEWVSAPTQSQLQKWLREKHGIDILVQRAFSNGIKKYILTPCFDKPIPKGYESVEKNNYEEALEIALFKALKYTI